MIPAGDWADFLKKFPHPGRAAIRSFADKSGIAPGIVVGRLQNDGIINHRSYNDLKCKCDFSDDVTDFCAEN